ncbi:MAG TPA: hypothetical protein VFS20_33250 [Longimicrobium sp.]|nr:hypothetical protein [Longimicrobium sp.]
MPLLARRIVPLLLLLPLVACSVRVRTPATIRAEENSLVSEARAFMESYAVDLREGRRDAIIARYDPRGAYMMGRGEKRLLPTDSITAIYRGNQWQPPASFTWNDLSYEVVGPDAVVVAGTFDWGIDASRKLRVSYTGLLLRRDGRWMIRLEDEDAAPQRNPGG